MARDKEIKSSRNQKCPDIFCCRLETLINLLIHSYLYMVKSLESYTGLLDFNRLLTLLRVGHRLKFLQRCQNGVRDLDLENENEVKVRRSRNFNWLCISSISQHRIKMFSVLRSAHLMAFRHLSQNVDFDRKFDLGIGKKTKAHNKLTYLG